MTDNDIEIRSENGLTEISDSGEFLEEVKVLFGKTALSTEVRERENVLVNGDDWQVKLSADGDIVFKPGGASLRFIRNIQELEKVKQGAKRLSFIFENETITVSKGIEHRTRG